jgi:bacterioferritin (cytochrome b1)
VSDKEPMDTDAVLDGLGRALVFQHRSTIQFATASGSLFGLEFQSLGERLWEWSQHELRDARMLVEKIVALGGEPPTGVARVRWSGEPSEAVEFLIETETETIETLQDVIPHTGDDGRSEALEHTLEHLIMRKQSQVDYLLRARRAR